MIIEFEQFRPVVGFEDYAVSNSGQVKRVTPSNSAQSHTWVGKILKPSLDKDEYLLVDLYKSGCPNKSRTMRVHRLVAQAFNPNPDNLPDVHHKDDVKKHNWASNLEWISKADHRKRTTESGLDPKGEKHGCAKLTWDEVTEIRSLYQRESCRKSNCQNLAKKFGVSRETIRRIAAGINWKTIPQTLTTEVA